MNELERLRKRNFTFTIGILLVVGVVALVIQSGMSSNLNCQRQQYHAAQFNPLTNDFQNLVKYKNDYVGNNSNDGAINANLALADIHHTLQVYPEKGELDIQYTESVHKIGLDTLRLALVYNATANFASIANLQSMTFVFPGKSYHVTRQRVETWYGSAPEKLTAESTWERLMQKRLPDRQYVQNAFSGFFTA